MENWKSVVGWEGLYEVSDMGRVKSLRTHGRAKGGVLKPVRKADGYLAVNLSANGRRKMLAIHRLVLEAFHGPIPEGMHGSHLDGTRDNNHLENLVVESASENCSRRAGHGTQAYSKATAKLTFDQVTNIRNLYKRGAKQDDLAASYGVTQGSISRIVNGRSWSRPPS